MSHDPFGYGVEYRAGVTGKPRLSQPFYANAETQEADKAAYNRARNASYDYSDAGFVTRVVPYPTRALMAWHIRRRDF
jgi:hypothetical protein